MSGAVLKDTVLIHTILIGVELADADLTGANLTRAVLDFAYWCDGCRCALNSIGTCVGCPPVEEVCTGLKYLCFT